MFLLVVFLIVSIFFSFLCSILEAVLLSITPAYVRKAVHEKSATGALIQEYKEDIDRPLSAILTLNTIAHTVGAIGVGAQAGAVFGHSYIDLGFLSISYESIIATVMTLAILILSEILPKTIGANNWESLAPFTMRTLRVLLFILWPLVWLSQLITKSLKKDKNESVLSRNEFALMARMGKESGALDENESAIIKNLLEFEKLYIRDIMTPKTVAVMFEEDMTLKEVYDKYHPIRYSRIPLFDDTRDNITGIVLKDDLLQNIVAGKGDIKIKEIKREAHYEKQDISLPGMFQALVKEKTHLSIVVDDFGSVVGLVSMEDLFETLLGMEIMDEFDSVADLQELARQKWKDRRDKGEK
ncbi:MAG: HlyC/CorC family transporter [Aureispira sp.]|nr:HlyC/CorC family transporter [Aureispira sp.]